LGLPQDVRELHEHQSWDQVFGSAGWCEAPVETLPAEAVRCPCIYDGTTNSSMYCSVRTKQFCLNDCSGRGQCDMGFCLCDDGYFDVDCSQHVHATPSAMDVEEVDARAGGEKGSGGGSPLRAPRVYVYDMPPEFTTRLLQYRADKRECVHRIWDEQNRTEFVYRSYPSETALHEGFLSHPLRTHDPEQADFFYVPLYLACYIYPVRG
jgi:hypothetical protein